MHFRPREKSLSSLSPLGHSSRDGALCWIDEDVHHFPGVMAVPQRRARGGARGGRLSLRARGGARGGRLSLRALRHTDHGQPLSPAMCFCSRASSRHSHLNAAQTAHLDTCVRAPTTKAKRLHAAPSPQSVQPRAVLLSGLRHRRPHASPSIEACAIAWVSRSSGAAAPEPLSSPPLPAPSSSPASSPAAGSGGGPSSLLLRRHGGHRNPRGRRRKARLSRDRPPPARPRFS